MVEPGKYLVSLMFKKPVFEDSNIESEYTFSIKAKVIHIL